MDRDTRRFVREVRRETRLLMAQCSQLSGFDSPEAQEAFDRETEVIMRSTMGGSANLAFFLPYLWKHRH
jgi:hypothetical protein